MGENKPQQQEQQSPLSGRPQAQLYAAVNEQRVDSWERKTQVARAAITPKWATTPAQICAAGNEATFPPGCYLPVNRRNLICFLVLFLTAPKPKRGGKPKQIAVFRDRQVFRRKEGFDSWERTNPEQQSPPLSGRPRAQLCAAVNEQRFLPVVISPSTDAILLFFLVLFLTSTKPKRGGKPKQIAVLRGRQAFHREEAQEDRTEKPIEFKTPNQTKPLPNHFNNSATFLLRPKNHTENSDRIQNS
ncbi:hypothetical protein CEXT_389581 [Caerostris extrusa]|uniref:Uncharacterized protein n=1 Tax=Caerostris extrusa TaxID=172846 RepID=A0AAV4WUQ7_CAEEX|nr:hypothetical protein CEXT_389581 [Caerostris extrusa]